MIKIKHLFKILLPLLFVITTISTSAEGTKEVENNRPENIRAIFLTASTVASKRFPELIEELVKSGGNAVVMDIEINGGQLAFEPANEFLKTINPGSTLVNNYKEIINYLHKKGVYAIARQVVFNDPYMSARRPDWRIKYKWWDDTFDYRWLDPSKPGVHYYNLMVMEEAVRLGFDEVQMDYIRFPATNHSILNYAYDEENFNNSDVINHFLGRARKMADKHGIVLSVDTFGAVVWGDVDWRVVGQHIPSMAKIVDVIYPMTYPSHYSPGYYGIYNMYYEPYDIVYESIKRFVEMADGNAEIRPYIQGFNLKSYTFSEKYIADQIQAGYDADATGFAIWNARNSYSYSWSSMDMEPEVNIGEVEIEVESK